MWEGKNRFKRDNAFEENKTDNNYEQFTVPVTSLEPRDSIKCHAICSYDETSYF